MVENLVHLGFDVTLVEQLDQILAPLDREHARLVEGHLRRHGVHLALSDGVAGFAPLEDGSLEVRTQSGKTYPADIVILALGVRPDTTLAGTAGLAIGERGGIRVDEQMRTSDPDILAVGDAVEVKDCVTGHWNLVALVGPANRQGRIAADVIAGRDSRFRGTQGTAIIGLFGAAAAWTGVSEKTLRKLGDLPISHWNGTGDGFLLDVREPVELAVEQVPGALNIPLGQLRSRLGELPRDRDILIICRSGQRAYLATRILLQHGLRARNLAGGMLSRAMLSAE